MSLGEAFVEVHADLRPFSRDLRRNIKPIVDAFERELNGAVTKTVTGAGEESGRKIGDHLSIGLKRSVNKQLSDKNIFVSVAGALASALDDGISALPAQVKAAIVAGILAATPIAAAYLSSALTAGIGVAVAALGVALAFQFTEVQAAATRTGRTIREVLVSSAYDFGRAVLGDLETIEGRIRGWRPLLRDVFDLSAPFLEPLVQGSLEGIEEILRALRESLGDIGPFVDELGASIKIVLSGVAEAIRILSKGGQDGTTALRDLARIVSILIVSTSTFLTVMVKLYGVLREIVRLSGFTIWSVLFQAIDRASNKAKSYINTNTELVDGFDALAAATAKENQEMRAFSAGLEKLSNQVRSQLELNISWEESLDNIADALKRNGDTLDITTEKGRENARAFNEALKIAEESATKLVREGKLTNEQALAQFDAQAAALRRMAVAAGLSEREFNALFAEIIATSRLRISSEEIGLEDINNVLGDSGDRAQRLLDLLQMIKHLSSTIARGALGGVRGLAGGGVAYLPETINVAEDGPEAIIPLTKPARAAQLMHSTGLDSILGGSGTTQVLVFIGSEQLEARMVKVVEKSKSTQALGLSQGGRTF